MKTPDLSLHLPTFLREAGAREWVFSLRLFVAGMVALYLALWLGLEEPRWSLMTVYIVAQPLTGMALAKGAYRFLGTLVGAITALALTAWLVQSPFLLLLVLALWMGFCTFGSSLLRNFRSYAFVLSGYSAIIIVLPAMADPAHVFNIALARVTEISLGVFCSTLAAMLVWPRSAGETFLLRGKAQFHALLDTVAEVAVGSLDETDFQARRRQLVIASVELENLREHALFDTPALRRHAASCRRFGHELLSLLSTLGPLHAYVSRYAQKYAEPDLQALLTRLAALKQQDDTGALRTELLALHEDAQQLAHKQRESLLSTDDERFYAGQLLLEQTAEICDRLRSSLVLFAMINGDEPHRRWRAGVSQLHLDPAQAGRNAVRVILAMLATTAFWWWSGSLQGEEMLVQVAVVCALFATRDNPVQAAQGFVNGALISAGIAFCYYLLLPGSEGFFALVLWLAPVYLLAGLAMTRQQTLANASALMVFLPGLLNLGPHQVFSIPALINGTLGLFLGLAIAIFAFLLLWPSDKADRARLRLCQDMCRAVAHWPLQKRRPRHELETLLYDRLARTFPQLQTRAAGDAQLLQGAMALVTLALVLSYLDAICRRGLPPAATTAIQGIIASAQQALEPDSDATFLPLTAKAEAGIRLCRSLYGEAAGVGERRRLVRAIVRLRMLLAILRDQRAFLIAGTTSGREYWQAGEREVQDAA